MKRFNAVAVLVALVLFAGTAFAQGGTSLGWGQRAVPIQSGTSPQGQLKIAIVGGVNPGDTTGVPFTMDGTSGGVKTVDTDRDRDFPLLTQLFSGQQILQGAAYSMPYAVPLLQYTRSTIMLTWAAGAVDSDSVRIAVRVYGTTSSTSGNWHLWTPMTTYTMAASGTDWTSDSCVTPGTAVGDSSNGHGRCIKPISFWVTRDDGQGNWVRPKINASLTSLYYGTALAANTSVNIRKLPKWSVRWASANSVMLNLTDQSGATCPFPYIRIEVYNASGRGSGSNTGHLTNVEANLWPRVQ